MIKFGSLYFLLPCFDFGVGSSFDSNFLEVEVMSGCYPSNCEKHCIKGIIHYLFSNLILNLHLNSTIFILF